MIRTCGFAAYIDAHGGEVDENGYRLVVRNGFHQPREVVTAAGAVPVRAPRVNDKRFDAETGERRRFCSAILPAWARKSPQVAEVLPLLYLHGLSSSDFGPALEQFLGSAAGLSAATITRLTAQWQHDAEAFNKRSLKDTDYVYVWVDGIHPQGPPGGRQGVPVGDDRVRADGTKELVALADGFRESSQSWADLLRSCRRRGMTAPVLAVGDGALGFWKALREVFPDTRDREGFTARPSTASNPANSAYDSTFEDSPGPARVRRLAKFAGGCQPDCRVRAGHRPKCG